LRENQGIIFNYTVFAKQSSDVYTINILDCFVVALLAMTDFENINKIQGYIMTNEVKLGQWIRVGIKDAVVCSIYDEANIEVVYLDDRDRAINEDAVLQNDKWEFKVSGACGGYADKYSRLNEYVSILRIGYHNSLQFNKDREKYSKKLREEQQ